MFVLLRNCERGVELMTKNEQELINIIRTSENPQQAMVTAIDIITQYIKNSGGGVPLDFSEQTS